MDSRFLLPVLVSDSERCVCVCVCVPNRLSPKVSNVWKEMLFLYKMPLYICVHRRIAYYSYKMSIQHWAMGVWVKRDKSTRHVTSRDCIPKWYFSTFFRCAADEWCKITLSSHPQMEAPNPFSLHSHKGKLIDDGTFLMIWLWIKSILPRVPQD